ncbi:MAG: ABC transporter permease [Vicinamibacterales bacterium]
MMLWKRLGYLLPWRRRAAELDMQEELRAIRAMAAPGELGNLTLAAEDARAEWGWTRLEQTVQDLQYALRTLRKAPTFTAAAVMSLAIGIGANTALFTLINTAMWKLLPVRDPEHLLVLGQQSRASVSNGFTYQQYELFRDSTKAFDFAAYSRVRLNVSIDGAMEPTLDGQLVTGDYFSLLGIEPFLGRLLGPDDHRVPMGHPVAVLAHTYFERRFDSDPTVVGRSISLSGVPFTIVGVAPRDFFGTEVGTAPSLFAPVMMQPTVMPMTVNLLDRPNVYSTWLRILGRLEPGVSLEQAAGQLDALARVPETDWRPRNKFTGQPEDVRLVVSSAATGISELRRQFSQPLFVLLGVTGIVLLVACANVGNLMLARSATRRTEFALRLALGARSSRLFRQVLVEGLVLATFGGLAGVALAFWATQALVAYASAGRGTIIMDLSPDLRVLAFTAALSMFAGIIFGSVPAFRASRAELSSGMRGDLAHARTTAPGSGPGRVLVVTQVALSLVLLVAAGLFVRSLQHLSPHEIDGDPTRVLIVRVETRGSGNRNQPGAAERFDRMYRELILQIERIPGVQSASLARTSPLAPSSFGFPISPPAADEPRMMPALIVYPGYFATVGIPIVRGRDFNEDDLRPGTPLTVLVNETFVRMFMNGREPLGTQHDVRQAARRGRSSWTQGVPLNIIGVVKDTRFPSLRDATPPTVYQTFMQANTGFAQMVLHVRVTRPDPEITRQVRETVQSLDSVVPMFDIHSLAEEIDAALVRERLVATLSSVFGLVALTLVCVGLYGLLAFTVCRRTPEIGVRVALGATRSDVRWMIARQALTIVCAGLAVGLLAAWIAGRLASRQLAGLLFELRPTDATTMLAASILLMLVAMCAGFLPAHRASRIDPVVALRTE